MSIIQRGDTGADVRTIQTALLRAGYNPGPVNGVFGAQTETAVRQFQRVLGLEEDGIVGSLTMEFLTPFIGEPDPDVLRRGSKGRTVRILQTALEKSGFSPGAIDGLFGTKTQAAVKAFQAANEMNETGVVDYATWTALAPYIDFSTMMLRRGDTGGFVRLMQTALKNAGHDPGTIDGVFGSRTEAAVKAFQDANDLTADGIIGRRTSAKLVPYLGGCTTYTVKSGDTLTSIARQFNTTVDAIATANSITNPNRIYVGDVLVIPITPISWT